MNIPTDELLTDVRNHLQCLPPHVKERKTALLLRQLVDRAETLQDIVRLVGMLIQPGPDGPQLEGHVKFRDALFIACRNNLRTPDDLWLLAKVAAEAKGGE